jgi:hypothetical protein
MRKNIVLCALPVSLLAGGFSVLFAFQAARLIVDVPFEFMAGKTQLPAGKYEISQIDMSAPVLVIRNVAIGKGIDVPFLTRLAPRDIAQPEAVFDNTGTQNYLSEIYIPATDGFLIQGAPGNHTHKKIKATK